MLQIRAAVASDRLLVKAQVSAHPRLVAAKAGVGASPPRRLTLMVDTGARHTAIVRHLLDGLGPFVGVAPVRTLQNVVDLPICRVGVSLLLVDPAGVEVAVGEGLSVIAIPQRPSNLPADMTVPYEGVVGMDLLRHFRLAFDGPGQQFSLAYEKAVSAS